MTGEFSLKPKNQPVTDVAGAQQILHSLNKKILGKLLDYSKVGHAYNRSDLMQKTHFHLFAKKFK